MAKRSQQAVPATETGKIPGDYSGSRQFTKMPTKGGRNATTNEAKRGAGQVAPRPQASRQGLLASSSASAPTTASMARVTDSPNGDSALRLPLQSPKANLASKAVGQREADPGGLGKRISPQTRTPVTNHPVATAKPRRKGLGSAFYGEN
jgi:hypothetical protein